MNRVLPTLHGGSLKITLTVPLSVRYPEQSGFEHFTLFFGCQVDSSCQIFTLREDIGVKKENQYNNFYADIFCQSRKP